MRKEIKKIPQSHRNNKKGHRMRWDEHQKEALSNLWEWGSYEELRKAFPHIGINSLRTKVGVFRKEGYVIPERKLKGISEIKWISPQTGIIFAASPKFRRGDKKKVWTIAVDRKRFYRYRYEIENYLKRKLIKGEEVHHLDGNPENDDISNLVVVTKEKHFPFDNYRANMAELFIKENNLFKRYIEWVNENKKVVK